MIAAVSVAPVVFASAGSPTFAQGAYGDGSFSNNPMLSSGHFTPRLSAHQQPVAPPPFVLASEAPLALEPPVPMVPPTSPTPPPIPAPIYKDAASPPAALNPAAVPHTLPSTPPTSIAPPTVANVAPPLPASEPLLPPVELSPIYAQGLRPSIGSELHPALEVDWSVGLRGALSFGTNLSVWSAIITPEVELTLEGRRSEFSLSSDFEGVVTTETLARVSAFNTEAAGSVALSPVTGFTYGANLNISQDDVNAPGAPTGVEILPINFSGGANVGITQQLGQLIFDASLNGSRTASTDTYMTDGSVEKSQDQNFWGFGGALRTSFQATPIFAPFVELTADRSIYDAAPTTTGMKLDNYTYSVRGGAVATWQDSLSIEASTGYALSQFDDAGLNDMGGQTFALAIDFAPPSGVSVGLDIDTAFNPGDPDNSIVPTVAYGIGGSLGVDVGDRLFISALASANWQAPLSSGPGTMDYSLAVGAAYSINAYAALTLDYTYSAANDYLTAIEDEHVILAGVTVSRPE